MGTCFWFWILDFAVADLFSRRDPPFEVNQLSIAFGAESNKKTVNRGIESAS
jgi:hypothetical protein